ncbi:MAG: N-acetyltransferase family protein [Bacteroidales bacterium]
MNIVFRPMVPVDWNSVAVIYKEGIDTGNATFQKDVPSWEEWDRSHLKTCRIVAEAEGRVEGWAALTAVSGRCVYAGVAEVSVYVSEKFKGQKIGTRLLEALISESEKEGFWTLQAGIFPENLASLKIHKNLGFREVGYREKIGKMDGVWRDTILLERRSKKIM